MSPQKSMKQDKAKDGKKPKTAPVSAKKSRFKFEDNPVIEAAGNSPYQLNTPRPLTFDLIDTKGRRWTYSSQRIGTEEWGSKEFIAEINSWYDQIIRRTCKAPDDPEAPTVKKRAQWSHHEKGYFEYLIRERIKKVGGELVRRDWEAIAEQQNERWAGKTLKIGERLVGKSKSGAGVVRKGWIISGRTWTSLRDILRKWPDTRQVMRQALSGLPGNDSDLGDLSDDLRQSTVGQEEGEGEDQNDDDEDDESDGSEYDGSTKGDSDDAPAVQRGVELMAEMRQVQEERGEEDIQRQLTSQRQILKDRNLYHQGG